MRIGNGIDLDRQVIKEVNEFILKNGIERADILEFRTEHRVGGIGISSSFGVVLSWWE